MRHTVSEVKSPHTRAKHIDPTDSLTVKLMHSLVNKLLVQFNKSNKRERETFGKIFSFGLWKGKGKGSDVGCLSHFLLSIVTKAKPSRLASYIKDTEEVQLTTWGILNKLAHDYT